MRSNIIAAFAGSLAALTAFVPTTTASDGIRVAAWNITNYTGAQGSNIATAVYGTFEGRSFAPDVILLQEFSGSSAVTAFAGHLNAAPGSPGDWAAAPTFVFGNLNTALVYRTTRFDLLDTTLVAPGGFSPVQPRNVVRYDLRLDGYGAEDATFAMYPSHMKAGSGSGDQARRLVESNEILNDAAILPAARHLILGGDFNTQSSNQPGFRALVGNTYNTGVFIDPITVPGSWNNSSAFRMIHTQDPATQVDDRYDLLLLSQSLVDGTGAEYIGDFNTPWDLSRWDDPNHSHRCWGNDGSSYNTVLRTTGNENCGPVIAQALIALSSGLGHLPVYLDIAVPAKIGTNTAAIDLGDVPADSPFDFTLDAGSGGDVSLWGESGIEASDFSFFPGPGITSPVGAFTDAPGGTLITFDFTLDPAAVPAGAFNTYIDIASNDPDEPLLRIPVAGNRAIGGCNIADIAAELGVLNVNDIVEFVNAFNAADTRADISPLGGDGVLNVNDIVDFVNAFNAGCP